MREMSLDQIANSFDKIGDALEAPDLTPVWQAATGIVRTAIGSNFDKKATPDGSPWPSAKTPQSHPLLNKTGEMKRSATTGIQVTVGELAATYRDTNPIAPFHNNGTRNIRKREFFGIGEQAQVQIEETLADFIDEELSL
jgi:phage gpG-like protein